MKYLVLIPDGMADYPVPELDNKTPMEVADKPCMDALAKDSFVGTVLNVPVGMVPESDTANMAILSFDPKIYSHGRSPLEAVSMGIEMQPDETAYRCNLVTLSEEQDKYEDRIMLDHSSDEISTAEADVLIKALEAEFGSDILKLYTGVSYRHCLIIKNGNENYQFMRPHDIPGRRIGDYLPREDNGGGMFLEFMKKSYDILSKHPLNAERRARGLRPANSAWLWSPGKKPQLPSFRDKWGLDATVISAVDLIKGIGICAGMKTVNVEGATGNVHTNYKGKADAAINAFENGADYVYIHVEAPDECGHRAELDNKVKSIALIDKLILAPVLEYLKGSKDDFKIMVLPDHPTPIKIRTHTSDPVPFFIYDSKKKLCGVDTFNEANAKAKGYYLANGYKLMDMLISG